MKNFLKGLVDLIYPPFCFVCGSYGQEPLCDKCISSFPLVSSPVCEKCGKPCTLEVTSCRECSGRKFYFVKARVFGLYEGNLKQAIHKFKYHNGKRLAPLFAKLMMERVDSDLFEVDLVTWVPLSRQKEAMRGFNQAHLLAKEISKLDDKPSSSTLELARETLDQSKLSLVERKKNVRGAFSVAQGIRLNGKSILLIDDVFTTGSTINECSKVLLKAGAQRVQVLTVARSILH